MIFKNYYNFNPAAPIKKIYLPESKPGKARIVESMPLFKFTNKQKKVIIDVLEQTWGFQIDAITWERVQSSLQNMSIDWELETTLTESWQTFGDTMTGAMSNSAYVAGSSMAGDITALIDTSFYFDAGAPALVEFLQNEVGELIVEMSSQQIGAIRLAIQNHFKYGHTAKFTKGAMEKAVTLTEREAEAVFSRYIKFYEENFKRFYNSGLLEADAAKRADSIAMREMDRYFRQVKRRRVDRIYQTELSRVKGIADRQAMSQAIDQNKISRAVATWRKTNYRDNWKSSDMYDGRWIDIASGEDFSKYGTPDPTTMISFYFPSEINEQCVTEYDVWR